MLQPDAIPQHVLLALDKVAQTLNEQQVSYALIGGLGTAVRGPLRATRDVDLLVSIPQLKLPGVLSALVQAGFQLDVEQAIGIWTRDHILAFYWGPVRIDWLMPVLPAFEHILSRARWEQVGDRRIRVADAEGLLLLKLIAFRARDQEDIKGILAANSGTLDLDWVRREWFQIVGVGEPRTEQFEQFAREFYNPAPS